MGRGRSEADPALKRRNNKTKKDTGNNSGKTGFDGFTVAPWRKTVSIFKQPVTLVHTTRNRDNKRPTSEQLKRGLRLKEESAPQKPVQMMWSKSLEGIEAVVPLRIGDKIEPGNESLPSRLELPARILPAASFISNEAAVASLCTALHNPHAGMVTGQKKEAKTIECNPRGAMETEQPLIAAMVVMEEDVKTQERRVIDARKRLQEIRKHMFIP